MDNNLLGNEQYGFRTIQSTAWALSRASNNWLINIDTGSLNSVIFLDIQKAFDTVDHEIMLNKLRCYGVQEDELKFLYHILTVGNSVLVLMELCHPLGNNLWCATGVYS